MLKNWKAKLSALGTFLLAALTWLAFFGIDAKTLREQMTTHYVFLIAALVFTALFAVALRYWWLSTRVTVSNAQSKIGEWLAKYNYAQRPVTWDTWHWGFEVTQTRGPLVFIARPKVFEGEHLLFVGKIKGVSPQYRAAFDALSVPERQQFYGQLELETARSKIFFRSDAILDEVAMEKWIPITPKFTATDMVQAIAELEFSAQIIWKTVSLRFGGKPELTPPSSTPDTEASPPSPA
jgi:hypothetical protein